MNKKQSKQIPKSWYFLILMIVIYIIFFIFDKEAFSLSFNLFTDILIKIIPVFLLIFILTSFINHFVTRRFIEKHLQDKGLRKWFFAIVGGMLSTGPMYMWYPLLSDLKDKGFDYGHIACFLYNRAIKLPLIPIAVLYFGWKYIIVLSLVMMILSVFQGLVINKLLTK